LEVLRFDHRNSQFFWRFSHDQTDRIGAARLLGYANDQGTSDMDSRRPLGSGVDPVAFGHERGGLSVGWTSGPLDE
jgi:hypothetical protein